MITKAEAMAKLTAREEAEYAQFEKVIDERLREHDGRTAVYIAPGHRIRERLVKAYTDAGWTVECGDDQRDGAWMAFS